MTDNKKKMNDAELEMVAGGEAVAQDSGTSGNWFNIDSDFDIHISQNDGSTIHGTWDPMPDGFKL